METIDELTAFLATATVDGILGRLLYRGAAWSLMREEGVLPANAPPLGATIETDLAEHGFALLRGAMALRAQAGASDLTSKAFERAANAFEALVRNGDPESPDRGFRRTIAAAAYHLAGFSAVAADGSSWRDGVRMSDHLPFVWMGTTTVEPPRKSRAGMRATGVAKSAPYTAVSKATRAVLSTSGAVGAASRPGITASYVAAGRAATCEAERAAGRAGPSSACPAEVCDGVDMAVEAGMKVE